MEPVLQFLWQRLWQDIACDGICKESETSGPVNGRADLL